ncbi:hypothetical protein D3C81_1272970 [compost metagenome]
MASISAMFPAVIVAEARRDVRTIEAIEASKPLSRKTLIVLRRMLMPDRRAASRLPPIA